MSELATRDLAWARKITERLRLQATNYQEAREKVLHTLTEARDGGAAELLGYASWTAYMADVFADAPLRLERDARQELVAELAAEGMSTRAIAPIVGVSHTAVRKDIDAAGGNNFPPQVGSEYKQVQYDDGEWSRTLEPVSTQTMMQVNPETGVVEDVPSRIVTGRDGKEYTVPTGRKAPPKAAPEAGLSLVNDVRLYLRTLAKSREVNRLTTAGRQHIIDALRNAADELERNQS